MAAEFDPPEPEEKSATLGTSQVWAWSHCTRGEIIGVPTGTGYFTSEHRPLPSTLMLKRRIKILLLVIRDYNKYTNAPKESESKQCEALLTRSYTSFQCLRGRTQGCWRGLSSSGVGSYTFASDCASGWPVRTGRRRQGLENLKKSR